MRRYLITIPLGWLFISTSLFSQSLVGYMWQLQNPKVAALSELIGFDNDYFNRMAINLETRQISINDGNCKISNNTITLKFNDNKKTVFKLKWLNPNKVILSNDKDSFIYAKLGSAENKYFYPLTKVIICKDCDNTGICNACDGTGIFSICDYSGPCAACSGSGKCWHCQAKPHH